MNKDYILYAGAFLLGFSITGITASLITPLSFGWILGIFLSISILLFVGFIAKTIEEKTIEYHITNYYTNEDYHKKKGGKNG